MIQKLNEMLNRLTWSHVILIVGGAAAVFFYLQDNSDIEQKEQGIIAAKQNITTLNRKVEEAKEFEKQFEEKKKKYSELVKSLQNLKEALPRQFFLPDLLTEVQREAKQLEVEVVAVHPDQTETQSDLYNSIGFILDLRTSFLQYFIFLDRLAHMNRLINVERYSIGLDSSRSKMTYGGERGVFSGTALVGDEIPRSTISVNMRVITYRYRGSGAPDTSGGGKK